MAVLSKLPTHTATDIRVVLAGLPTATGLHLPIASLEGLIEVARGGRG